MERTMKTLRRSFFAVTALGAVAAGWLLCRLRRRRPIRSELACCSGRYDQDGQLDLVWCEDAEAGEVTVQKITVAFIENVAAGDPPLGAWSSPRTSSGRGR